MTTVLPPLVQRKTPNRSSRNGTPVTLLVWHESAGAYAGSVSWLCNPQAQASAHIVIREDGLQATQLVALAEKAWHAEAFNGFSVGVEHADTLRRGYATEHQLEVSARTFAWLCHTLSVPPRWSHDGQSPGITRHKDLGSLGGGHFQCGTDDGDWIRFLNMVHANLPWQGKKAWAR